MDFSVQDFSGGFSLFEISAALCKDKQSYVMAYRVDILQLLH